MQNSIRFQFEGFWEIRDTRLFVRTVGDPTLPVLLVLHGGPGGSHGKLLPLSKLSSKFFVVFYDQRGTGDSDRFDVSLDRPESLNQLTLEQNILDMKALQEKLQRSQISILGHSWGGALAALYAAEFPETIDRLIIYSGGPEDLTLSRQKQANFKLSAEEKERLRAKDEEMQLAAKAGCPQSELDRMCGEAFQILNPSFYRVRPKRTAVLGQLGYWANAVARQYSYELDLAELSVKLQKLKCRSLLIWGRHEPSPQERLLFLLDNIANSRLVIFENSAHNALEEEPELFFAVLNAFFEDRELPIQSFADRSQV